MAVSVTEHFKLDKKAFASTGAFDALLDQDTHLFVDPFLLKEATDPIFKNGRDDLLNHFREIIKLLTNSKKEGDVFWRNALNKFKFREIAGFGLGYAKIGTSGSGIGEKFTASLIQTADAIVKAGVIDPEIFELVGLFEEGIGCDRISDMTAAILLPLFLQYSDYVFTKCGQKYPGFTYRDQNFNIPRNPFRKNTPVLLCPMEFLRDLPVANDWGDIGYVCDRNEQLRNKLNDLLGADWRDKTKGYTKTDLRKFFVKNPILLKETIESYKKSKPLRYDWESDPSGEYAWRNAALACTTNFPLALEKKLSPAEVSDTICDHFKELIETNGLWRLLYKDDKCKVRKHERASQLVFYGVASSYCKANDLDVSPESNGGSGPVDFKLSRGVKGKTIVEVKLSTNSKLLAGFEKQVAIYKKAEGADFAIYLILVVSESDTVINKLIKRAEELDKLKIPRPKIVIVDARPKQSASKA